jgi:SAM-dependent methyltransferase
MSSSYDELRGRGVGAFVRETGRDEYWLALAAQRATYVGRDGRARDELVEDVACAACGVAEARPVFAKDGFTYVRCLECGTLYVSPQLRTELLDEYWAESNVAARWLDVLLTPAQLEFDRAKYEDVLATVEQERGSPGRVLDIGSSLGVFLDRARNRGWEVAGVEPGLRARVRAEAEFGLTLHASLTEVQGQRFDLVTFWEVVEHTKRPVELLTASRALLEPGGTLLALVGGNAHALANRVMRAASAAFDFSRLWYFSPSSFARLLKRAGLAQTSYSSVLAELDTTLNYLRYDDPYDATFREEVLPAELIERLETVVLGSDLGYKFLSLARPTSINQS